MAGDLPALGHSGTGTTLLLAWKIVKNVCLVRFALHKINNKLGKIYKRHLCQYADKRYVKYGKFRGTSTLGILKAFIRHTRNFVGQAFVWKNLHTKSFGEHLSSKIPAIFVPC